ncbi:hypothetical protein ZIOFF_034334 [Zingiber officinale]|uniref:Protein JASON n=2 Tax=Zingiber officinale TaxID=94328 RepID=A0A8J5GPC5_ZINOF|nr:hypothetical protein ZIOFF_034334 [Zingiber officinale]
MRGCHVRKPPPRRRKLKGSIASPLSSIRCSMAGSRFRLIKEVLGFFESVLVGCLFGCFRVKDDARRKTNSSAKTSRPEEKANFIKNCPSLSKVPEGTGEIFNGVFAQTPGEDDLPSNLPSQPTLSGLTSDLNGQNDHIQEGLAKPEDTSSRHDNIESCMIEQLQTVSNILEFDVNTRVSQLDCQQESVNLDVSPSHIDSKTINLDSDSPFPTPLNINEELQTPGTFFRVNLDNRRTGKHARIHNQYIYPVLKPVENLPQWIALRQQSLLNVKSDESFEPQLKIPATDSRKRSNQVLPDTLYNGHNFILQSPSRNGSQEENLFSFNKSRYNESLGISAHVSGSTGDIEPETLNLMFSSLSKRLKCPILNNEKGSITPISNEQFHEMNNNADRPIIGTAAAYWNDAELLLDFQKEWDGNGIPNTTTKYKEDQKVNWHATPFEERLEKVLSADKHLPQRKLLYRESKEIEEESMET